MGGVAEHLAQALCSLSKLEKIGVINLLLGDAAFREVLSEFPIKKLIGLHDNQHVNYSPISDSIVTSRSKGKRERGKQLRQSYLAWLQQNGILIEPFDNVWAETPKGLWVAIPTATIESRPGRWFLGLPENRVFEKIKNGSIVIILLCQSATGSRLDFVIPPNVVSKVAAELSTSKGQLKFNVKKVGNRYYLVIPHNNGDVDISGYKGNISILRI